MPPLSVRVCGALNGAVTLQRQDEGPCTLGDLRREVARLLDPTSAGGGGDADDAAAQSACKLILAGRVLAPSDDARPLSELRVGPSSRVLVTRAPPAPLAAAAAAGAPSQQPAAAAALSAEAARAQRLERLRACAARMAARDGLRSDGYAF